MLQIIHLQLIQTDCRYDFAIVKLDGCAPREGQSENWSSKTNYAEI